MFDLTPPSLPSSPDRGDEGVPFNRSPLPLYSDSCQRYPFHLDFLPLRNSSVRGERPVQKTHDPANHGGKDHSGREENEKAISKPEKDDDERIDFCL